MSDMLLSSIFILTGTVVAVMGLVGWKTKNIRILCGFREMKVDTDRYVKFMGFVTISFGLFYIALGILEYFSEISRPLFLIGFAVYTFLVVYGRRKYRLKD